MADRFQGVSERTVELALALNPIDARTETPLRGEATVSIDGVTENPRLNPTGYWLFLDPPTTFDSTTVTVTVDPPSEYAERTLQVDTTQSPPAERIPIYPSTAYSFPTGTTLIQGTVTDGTNDPVSDATVSIEHTDLVTRTDTDGSFVLELSGIATTESIEPDDRLRVDTESDHPKRVKVYPDQGPSETPTIVVDHPDHDRTTRPQQVTEGEHIVLTTPISL